MTAAPEVIEAAISQVEQGFAAFALAKNAKAPVTVHGFKNATRKPDWIRTQLLAPPAGNYGIVWPLEAEDRVVVFDLDNGEGAERPWQDRLLERIEEFGPLPSTKVTITPSGGRHAFYRWPRNVPIPSGDELFGFTVRWPGRGYLVGPGSSIDGVPYEAGPNLAIADLPAGWVVAAVAERGPARSESTGSGLFTVTGGYVLPDRIPSGRRYATVRDYVASRYNAGLSEPELWELVRSQVAPRFETPKTEADLRADFGRVMARIAERLGPPARAGATAAPAAAIAGPLEDSPLTSFASTPISWLWPGWLPRGVVTLMDGNPGVSKSTLVADLVARITTGADWPDGTPQAGGSRRVVWVTTEDDPGRVLRPRIEAAGGDASLVRFVTSEVVLPGSAEGFTELLIRRAVEPGGLAFAILDPLFSHIDAKVRSIADAEMRQNVMNPLNRSAEAADVAILVVRHFNKDTAASAINRGAGSLGGIVGAARALWSVTLDPEDETGETKAVGVSKLNYARIPRAQRYRVVDRLPPGWVSGSVSGIEWLGETSVSITEMMAEDSSVAGAVTALEQLLSGGRTRPATEVQDYLKGRGFSRTAIRGAKTRLAVTTSKSGMTGGWTWSLPAAEGAPPRPFEESEGAPPATSEGLARASAPPRGRGAPAPSDSSDSSKNHRPFEESEGAGPSRARGGAHEDDTPVTVVSTGSSDWASPCLFYADHTSTHRWTAAGWTCDACHPDRPDVVEEAG